MSADVKHILKSGVYIFGVPCLWKMTVSDSFLMQFLVAVLANEMEERYNHSKAFPLTHNWQMSERGWESGLETPITAESG